MKFKSILLACAAVCVAACGNDDGTTVSAADNVCGTYKGELTLAVMGDSQGSMTMDATIARETASTVGVTLTGDPDATGGMTIKNIQLTGIGVAAVGNGSTYTLAKTIGEDGYTAQDTGTATNWKFTVVEGSVTDDTATLKLVGQPGAMPMAITMDFKGTK